MPLNKFYKKLLCVGGLFLLLTAYCLLPTVAGQTRDFARWVNPFIGTGGHGHTFPGAVVPFGMVQPSPDTREANWDGSSGHHYSDDIIYGFSHTHLSGTGIPDGCDILFMPTVGEPQFFAKAGDKSVNGYASKFSHANEKAEAGYYSVKLDDDGILAEVTTTPRVGMHRYTFSSSDAAYVLLDLNWRDFAASADVKQVSPKKLEGFRISSSWAKYQVVYFAAEFSKPFQLTTDFLGDILSGRLRENSSSAPTQTRKVALGFLNVHIGDQIIVKVALSSVSMAGARKNLKAELPGWDFDKVRADAKAAWNKELSKIEVSGGTSDQTTTFYTALYHTMIHPSIFNDVDGRYKGHDGKIHHLPGYAAVPPYLRRSSASPRESNNLSGGSAAAPNRRQSRKALSSQQRKSGAFPHIDGRSPTSDQYTGFSLWDTFRAAHPLYTIIDQKRTVDFINTFIRMYEQGGRLPVWELWGNETDTMIGYHAVSVIADAMAKGIKGFDYEKAYAAAKHSAELDHFGLAAYKKRGYISMEDENESVSKTLEYAYNDWCITMMAWGREEKTKPWDNNRGAYFENLFDPETGFFRPKKNGDFVKPFAPNEVTFNFTEANAWQYAFFVPQDIERLKQLMGGESGFEAKLDQLFSTTDKLAGRDQPDITGLIGQYAHGNEPSHHIAYLYDYTSAPWKGQKRLRQIMDDFYKPTPDGLVGNEDCGQMSAWYVLSAMGFYPVAPGLPRYEIGTPLFKEAKINLENGQTFVISAPNVSSQNIYVQTTKIDGVRNRSPLLYQFQIAKGGSLEFEMGPTPIKDLFDPTKYEAYEFVTVPLIVGDRVFNDKTTITLKMTTRVGGIHYTIDGSEPTEKSKVYDTPFTINASTTVKAIGINAKGSKSFIETATFHKKPNDWQVKIDSKYNRQYTGGGDEGLIDDIRGTVNFASGEWQGYQGQDFVATIDLQKETEIKKLGGGFLQAARSWIWMPTHIVFEVSSDNVNFTRVADIKTDIDPTYMESKIRDYVQTISPVKARYVRVHAYNLGMIPAWHPGAGDDSFIFVDEIFID